MIVNVFKTKYGFNGNITFVEGGCYFVPRTRLLFVTITTKLISS
ncbi:hypothetical protein METP3_01252 [Methanosarcinales archaeon]|nr:hypothetical protein METP3_01252 [Methanosarcinales archaeon]